jgi:phosphatidyl-myo-inositol dimannoside synthase
MSVERVILLSTEAGVGGIERSTRTLARATGDIVGSERVGFVTVWRETHQLPWPVLYSGRRGGGSSVSAGDKIRFTLNALRHSRRWRSGLVIVACHPHLAPVAGWMRAITSRPYAVWVHGEEVWGKLRPRVARSLQRADVVFAPSEFTARRVEVTAGLAPGSVVVIPHCLTPELDRLLTLSREPVSGRVLTVARLVAHHSYKGIDRVIEAWPSILERVPDATLVVGGDGNDRPRLEALARDLGVSGRVVFEGPVDDNDLLDLYGSSSVFVLASRTAFEPVPQGEGFGLVFVEAGAAGLPVVAGRGGPAPEIVVDGRTGVLVDPNSPAEIAEAIANLLADPGAAEQMGNAGRERVESEYSYPVFQDRVARMLEMLDAKNPTRT